MGDADIIKEYNSKVVTNITPHSTVSQFGNRQKWCPHYTRLHQLRTLRRASNGSQITFWYEKIKPGRTDQRTHRSTDRVTYRVACMRLKILLGLYMDLHVK